MKIRLGVDVACKSVHQASCADENGTMGFVGHRFRTDSDELEKLWARIPDGCDITVVMEPTRNAWVAPGCLVQAPRGDSGDGSS